MMKKRTLLVYLLSILLLLEGCIRPDPSHPLGTVVGTESATLPLYEPPSEHYYTGAVYVYQTEVDESCLTTELSMTYLILANKVHLLGADHAPAALSRLDASIVIEWQEKIDGLYLESTAARALYEMIEEMKHAGVSDIWVTSAYRDYEYQKRIFNDNKKKELTISEKTYEFFGYEYIYNTYVSKGLSKLSPADAEKVALSYSAAPGSSEHQTGLCVDFTTQSLWGDLNTEFENTEAFAWLAENAYKFGFILRYPKEKQDITGYTYEPWHYRFVGREAATDIYYSNLTLEEYLGAVSA